MGSAAVLIAEKIFVFGGGYKSIEVFDINELKWQCYEIESIPSIEIMSLAKLNNQSVLLFGGKTSS